MDNKLTWFAFNVFKKLSRLLTIPCQWAIKACCPAAFPSEREVPLTRLALEVRGAWVFHVWKWTEHANEQAFHVRTSSANYGKTSKTVYKIIPARQQHDININILISLVLKHKQTIFTWMHKPSKGDISFFKLSRIIPYIFSTYAVSCCLKSKAGYFASTWRNLSTPPVKLPFTKERFTPCGVPLKL